MKNIFQDKSFCSFFIFFPPRVFKMVYINQDLVYNNNFVNLKLIDIVFNLELNDIKVVLYIYQCSSTFDLMWNNQKIHGGS